MPQQSWLQGENSFLQGIDAGNRMLESIADVQSKQFALESAKTELPLRLMDLQLQNQQRMQALRIQREEAPLRLQNITLQGQEAELGIKSQQISNQLKSQEMEDRAVASNYLINRAMGESVPEPTFKTTAGLTFFNTAKASTDYGEREQMVKAEWKDKISKLTASQFSEVMNMPLGDGGHPTPAAWGRVDDYLKMNQEAEDKRRLNVFTEQEKAKEDRMVAVKEAEIKGKLDLAHEKSVGSVSGITDPIQLANVRRQLDAVKADPTLSLEQKLYRMEEITKKSKAPGVADSQAITGDADTQDIVNTLLTKRKELLAERTLAVVDGNPKRVKQIDDNLTRLNSELKKLPQGGASSGSGDGKVKFNPNTRTLDGYDGGKADKPIENKNASDTAFKLKSAKPSERLTLPGIDEPYITEPIPAEEDPRIAKQRSVVIDLENELRSLGKSAPRHVYVPDPVGVVRARPTHTSERREYDARVKALLGRLNSEKEKLEKLRAASE